MQLGRFGEANRFACEPLDAGAQCQMLALNLLRIAFPRHMNFRGQCRAYVPQWSVKKHVMPKVRAGL